MQLTSHYDVLVHFRHLMHAQVSVRLEHWQFLSIHQCYYLLARYRNRKWFQQYAWCFTGSAAQLINLRIDGVIIPDSQTPNGSLRTSVHENWQSSTACPTHGYKRISQTMQEIIIEQRHHQWLWVTLKVISGTASLSTLCLNKPDLSGIPQFHHNSTLHWTLAKLRRSVL